MSTPAQAPLLISLHGAAVRFGPVQALHPLNLQLAQGERLLLVGANGSGKTTLLRALHGLVPCTGQRVLHSAPGQAAPTLAMVFQKPFMLSLSVQANLRLGLWLRGVPRAERQRRCLQALQRVGLEGLAERPAHALSGGQQQRLAIARAWALRPQVLLLDEPTAHLDPSAKREVETLVAEIGAEGTTVVMSTHNLGQAKRLATRVAYMEGGRLVVDLPVQRFFTDTLPPEATQFLRGELPWQGAEAASGPR
ncbi:ABC transporter ATP-binding protein [beta proteobacterium AAP121]|nr:ABC transporter ATP-binding protein [beta proteobacterium AAP65]KPG00268.1 ABC transporter ATP-binding protein [beta proteobacterium AAP121]